MEDMGAVAVHQDPVGFFGIGVAGDMVPPFNHQHLFPAVHGFPGKNRAEQSRPDNKVIVPHQLFISFFSFSLSRV